MPTHPHRSALWLAIATFSWLSLPACKSSQAPAGAPATALSSARVRVAAPGAAGGPAEASGGASAGAASGDASARAGATATREPKRIEVKETAMGTHLTFIAFTTDEVDEAGARAAVARAVAEMRRLEALMSEWRADSEIGRLNAASGQWVDVSPETLEVLGKSLWAGKISSGTFDITFQSMSGLWKFGDAMDAKPKPPARAAVLAAKKLIDYRKVETDLAGKRARVGEGQSIGLGGIAKGYIVDRAVKLLYGAGLRAFLVQAGGDLYGAGHKPDGTRWISGIQDPRGAQGQFFATIELEDRAFSTAGDYARAYVSDGKRYHHIIDPRTGYPATACRSVTVWAPDAFVADAIDDAVFILGPAQGLPLIESLEGVGAVIIDDKNRIHISRRLEGKVQILAHPSEGL
jgi:thiamine biosynthesis lipoprotein